MGSIATSAEGQKLECFSYYISEYDENTVSQLSSKIMPVFYLIQALCVHLQGSLTEREGSVQFTSLN
jgi:hypothetical protein